MKISKKTAILIMVLALILIVFAIILCGAALNNNIILSLISAITIICIAGIYGAIGIIHL